MCARQDIPRFGHEKHGTAVRHLAANSADASKHTAALIRTPQEKGQAAGVAQIVGSIGRVSEVVQTNSAEECAAASKGLSGPWNLFRSEAVKFT